jgi:uncharacterized membrane protein YhaH (DUF805 family)
MKRKKQMTMTKITGFSGALGRSPGRSLRAPFWGVGLGHLGVLVIAILRPRPQTGDDQDPR